MFGLYMGKYSSRVIKVIYQSWLIVSWDQNVMLTDYVCEKWVLRVCRGIR